MNQEMHACSECGSGYLGVGTCPRCHPASGSDGTKIHIPWVRTGSGWVQQRIDGSTWVLSDRGLEPVDVSLGDVDTRMCRADKHTFMGTEGASCPFCNPNYRHYSAAASPQRDTTTRRRIVAYGAALLVVIAGVVAAVALTSGDDLVASEPPTTVTEAPTDAPVTSTLIADDSEFLDAVAYESALSALGMRAEHVANRVLEINAQWDSREITQEVAANQLDTQSVHTRGISADTDAAAEYGADATRHQAVAEAVQKLGEAIASVREGLMEPGSRSGRDHATVATVGATDRLLETIDGALDLDLHRLQRDERTRVMWESLRIGDCVVVEREGDYTEIAACSDAGRGEVLAIPLLPSSTDMTSSTCSKAALSNVDFERYESTEGSWDIREGTPQGLNRSYICTYVPEESIESLAVSDIHHVGPFVSNQWDALERIGLSPFRSVEAGECFTIPPDDVPELVSDRYRVDCDADHDFMLSAVVAVAPTEGTAAVERLNLRSWDVCVEAASIALDTESYFDTEALAFPAFPGIGDVATPMFTLACVLQTGS